MNQIDDNEPTAPEQEFLVGDVSCNDQVDSIDALFILQYVVDSRTDLGSCPLGDSSTQINASLGDVNADNQTNSIDALYILQCVVDIPNVFCP